MDRSDAVLRRNTRCFSCNVLPFVLRYIASKQEEAGRTLDIVTVAAADPPEAFTTTEIVSVVERILVIRLRLPYTGLKIR